MLDAWTTHGVEENHSSRDMTRKMQERAVSEINSKLGPGTTGFSKEQCKTKISEIAAGVRKYTTKKGTARPKSGEAPVEEEYTEKPPYYDEYMSTSEKRRYICVLRVGWCAPCAACSAMCARIALLLPLSHCSPSSSLTLLSFFLSHIALLLPLSHCSPSSSLAGTVGKTSAKQFKNSDGSKKQIRDSGARGVVNTFGTNHVDDENVDEDGVLHPTKCNSSLSTPAMKQQYRKQQALPVMKSAEGKGHLIDRKESIKKLKDLLITYWEEKKTKGARAGGGGGAGGGDGGGDRGGDGGRGGGGGGDRGGGGGRGQGSGKGRAATSPNGRNTHTHSFSGTDSGEDSGEGSGEDSGEDSDSVNSVNNGWFVPKEDDKEDGDMGGEVGGDKGSNGDGNSDGEGRLG